MEFSNSYKNSKESKKLIKSPDSFMYEKLFKIVNRQLEELRERVEDKNSGFTGAQYKGYEFEWHMWEFFNDLKPNFITDPDFEEPFRFDLSKYKEASNAQQKDGWNLVSKQGSKQMDVVAVFDKHVFVVECKHTDTEQGTSKNKFGSIIEDFAIRKIFIQKRIAEIFGPEFVPVFIICTQNFVLDNKDQLESLKNEEIIVLSEPEREYITTVLKGEKDKKTLKYKGGSGSPEFAFSQFLGFFRGDKPDFNDPPRKEKKWQVPAFHSLSGKGKKHKVFTFSISPEKMLKISTVAHQKLKNSFQVTQASNSYYQRVLSKKRLVAVSDHLMNTKMPFPNNILVSFRGKNIGWKPDSEKGNKDIYQGNIPGILEFDACPGSFHVIDGQHRLFGYTGTPKDQGIRKQHRLIVTAFDGLSVEDEAEIFLDVNSNAKPIAPDLLMEIEWASQAETHLNICNGVVFNLRDNEDSCLYDLILQAESRQRGRMSPKNMRTAISKLKILNKDFKNSIFWDTDITKTAENVYCFINEALKAFKESNDTRWKKKDGVIQDIFMAGIFNVIDRIAILEKGNIEKTVPYMKNLGKSFSKETNERKEQILNVSQFFTLGAAAPNSVAAWLVDTYLKNNRNLVEESDQAYLRVIDKEGSARELIKAYKQIESLQRQIIKFENKGLDRFKSKKSVNVRATEYCGLLKNIVYEVLARDDHYTAQVWEWLVIPAFWSEKNVWEGIQQRHMKEKQAAGSNAYKIPFNHVEGQPMRSLIKDFKKYKKAKPPIEEGGISREDRMNNTLLYIWEKMLIPPPGVKFPKKINDDPNMWNQGTEYMSIFEKCRNYGAKKLGSPHTVLYRETGDPSAEEKHLFETYYEKEFFNMLKKIRGDIENIQDLFDEALANED